MKLVAPLLTSASRMKNGIERISRRQCESRDLVRGGAEGAFARPLKNDTRSYIIIYRLFCQKLNFAKKFHQRFDDFCRVHSDVFITNYQAFLESFEARIKIYGSKLIT